MTAGGQTNHADAFTKAIDLFDMTSSNAKVIVMFTDGVTTAGDPPTPVASLAKSDGIIIYCIGLIGDTGLDVDALNDWSSDPDSAYVVVTPDDAQLEDLFEELAENISKPGATNIEITDTLNSCFKINNIVDVSKGVANILNDTAIKWEMDQLGTNSSEGATLEFSVSHIGACTGMVKVNDNIDYSDNEGNVVLFARALNVECSRLLGWIRRKEDIQKEFSDELAKGAEKYYKQNYNCLGNNSLLLIDRQTLNVSENESKNENPKAEYKIKDTEIEIKTKDLRYILDAMNMAINQQKETEEIYNKCLNVLQTGNKFIYRQIIVTVEYDRIILTINNKELLNKIASII